MTETFFPFYLSMRRIAEKVRYPRKLRALKVKVLACDGEMHSTWFLLWQE